MTARGAPADGPGPLDPVIAIVGPTATGKSELALDLGEALGAEIVNADAMQLYRGMDIGTAKVAHEDRRGIGHHQLDVLDIGADASVAAYQRQARRDVTTIAARGRRVIVVGGSGLYVRALLDEMTFPPTDDQVRARIQHRADIEGPGILHDELFRLDPAAASQIDRRNTRRIVRALEVIELTGAPFSAHLPHQHYRVPTIQLGVDSDDTHLDERIEARTRQIFADGLVEETASLLEQGLADAPTASRAVGYHQATAVVRGELTRREAHDQVTLATRQLARRQRKWFRRDDRISWLEAGPHLFSQAHRLCT